MYTTAIRPSLTYGAKCWNMYREYERKLTTTEMKILRMSAGVTKKDCIRSERLRALLKVKESIVEKVTRERQEWFKKIIIMAYKNYNDYK